MSEIICERKSFIENNDIEIKQKIIEDFRNFMIRENPKDKDFFEKISMSYMEIDWERVFMFGTEDYPNNLASFVDIKWQLIATTIAKWVEKYIKEMWYEKEVDNCWVDHLYKLDKNGKRIKELKPWSIEHFEFFVRFKVQHLEKLVWYEKERIYVDTVIKAKLERNKYYLNLIEKHKEKNIKQDEVRNVSKNQRKLVDE